MAQKKRKEGKSPQPGAAEVQLPPGAIRAAVPTLVVLLSLFAWSQGGVHEDGFFYLRVVDVFLHSGELAYNPGERFETNTDFLWTLLLIPGPAVGVHDILWMQLVGVAVYAAALSATFILARRLFSNSEAALLALVLLGGHYSFAAFAATGFGPVLQALTVLCCLIALLRFGESPRPRNGAALGLALLFLALCRLDSAVFGLPLVACALFFAWRGGKPALPGIACALGIPSVLFGGVLLWKLSYYGDVFPATYYAKSFPGGRDLSDFFLVRGAAYVALYWQRYFLWLLAAVAVFGAWRILRTKSKIRTTGNRPALLWTTGMMCVLWQGYMLRTGGDLTEFRFLTPQAPLMMTLAAGGLCGLVRCWRWVAACGALFFSALHWQTAPPNFFMNDELGVKIFESRGLGASGLGGAGTSVKTALTFEGGLRSELVLDENGSIAASLRDLFADLGEYPAEVRVAHLAGGQPAYVAPLIWTEMRGWADSRIGKAGAEDLWNGPDGLGHCIVARPRLLASLGVNLVYHHDFVYPSPPDFSRPLFPSDNPRRSWAVAVSASFLNGGAEFPPDSQLFALPLSDGRYAPVLYFNRNQTIDRILDEREIERVNVF